MLTVLLATRNGANTLPATLESFCALESPRGGWKLVVVDNGSTDETASIVRGFATRLPLTCALEPEAGKNRALNTGLRDVEGDLVVLTDDDVLPQPDWLARMRDAADMNPDFGIFGGVVVPRWEEPPQPWILGWVPLNAVFSVSDPAAKEGPDTGTNVFGPNMAIRANVFAAGYLFDPSIGPRGASYPMGSETELTRRLVRNGYRAWFTRAARVEHAIPRSHMQPQWIFGRAIRFGRGQFRLTASDPYGVKTWFGVPRYIFREIAEAHIHVMAAALTGNRESFFRAKWRRNYLLGTAIEARRLQQSR